jgi:hypothetical protein
MDKIALHKKIVRQIIEEVYAIDKNCAIIIDEAHGHYMLYNNVWEGYKRHYGCFLHLEVKENGHIWLNHDGTNLKIGEELLDKGISKTEIVLAFQSPQKRVLTGFAEA